MVSCSAIEFNHKTKEEFEDPYHVLPWLPEKFPSVFGWQMLTTNMPKMAVTAWLTFYRRMFLLKNDISWMNKNVKFEDTLFFIEAAFSDARMGTLKVPFYHRRVHSASTTQNIASYFNDLTFVSKHTLKMLKKMNIPKPIIEAYAITFLRKTYKNYLRFDPASKEKEMTNLYNFCLYMLKEYHLQYSKELLAWMQLYLKSKKLKKRLEFKFYWLRSKLFKNRYVIPFFEFQNLPEFKLKIFSIPLIEISINKVGCILSHLKF